MQRRNISRAVLAAAAPVAAAILMSVTPSAFGQTRVDRNGGLVGENNTPGFPPNGNLPLQWTAYGTGGGMGQRWDTGVSSETFGFPMEDEDAYRAQLLP